MMAKPEQQHEWLKRLVGDWTHESEVAMGPDQPIEKFVGTETVRTVGDLWIVAEGKGEMPGGGTASTVLTLGYDPQKGKIVGTWFGSMMAFLWVYEGRIEADGETLTLDTEGPDFTSVPPDGSVAPTKMAKYRETIRLTADGQRTFSSAFQGPDGQWTTMVTMTYKRK